MTIGHFLHDLLPKQILRQTDRHTLKSDTKIGAFVEKLSMNKQYIYLIHIYNIQTNCITFLPFEVG